MARFDVVYFEDESGVCPVKEFIDSQPVKMRAKIAMELALLQDLGNVLREPYSKNIEDGIFELRCKVASDITRLLYFFHEGRIVVLTNGFAKKGRKTPRKEIDLAKERRISYLKRRQKR